MEKRFSGQVAIITGGADGLGKAMAQRLAVEGAAVVIFDRAADLGEKTVAEFSREGLTLEAREVDVGEEESVREGVRSVTDAHGRLDIMINSAGIVGPNGKKISEVAVADYDEVCRVNLRGSFLMTKYAILAMTPRNYGRVLLVASIAGKEGNAGMCAYSSTKAGVIGLVKSVGKEYAETGITVNGLAPAVIRTAMVENMDPQQVKYMTDKIPMKRCGTLEEVASLAAWIVSPEAGFNTGFTFDLSGGRATY